MVAEVAAARTGGRPPAHETAPPPRRATRTAGRGVHAPTGESFTALGSKDETPQQRADKRMTPDGLTSRPRSTRPPAFSRAGGQAGQADAGVRQTGERRSMRPVGTETAARFDTVGLDRSREPVLPGAASCGRGAVARGGWPRRVIPGRGFRVGRSTARIVGPSHLSIMR